MPLAGARNELHVLLLLLLLLLSRAIFDYE